MKKRLAAILLTLAIAIAMMIPMAAPVFAASPNWELVETLTIDSNVNQVPSPGTLVYSQVLASGKTYLIEASGTYYANDWITADAKYCKRQGAPSGNFDWQDACGSYEATWPHVTELKVDGDFVEWGAYNADHVYTITRLGAGSAVSFAIYDLGANNIGSLTIKIYEAFGFNGLLAPYAPPAERVYKLGSTIPLKWQYTNSEGNVVDSANANPSIQWVFMGSENGSGELEEILDTPGTTGFSYDPLTMTWQFNWQTKGGNIGIYNISVSSFSPTQVNGPFPIALR